jgi:hypothetical protein
MGYLCMANCHADKSAMILQCAAWTHHSSSRSRAPDKRNSMLHMAGGAVRQLPQRRTRAAQQYPRLVIGGGKTAAGRTAGASSIFAPPHGWRPSAPVLYLCETCGAITNDAWHACRVHGVNSTSSTCCTAACCIAATHWFRMVSVTVYHRSP